ncbi:aminopeptidase B [Mytilus galloprovincialis]|uniref:Aminopeptidase B n=1 Tax=Mytilus galloprovincialis TaxID=29158 RepID=A0A8B6FG19_MYTGA|nr:aminopeptidase B [Mytilus galloprovincialis]
MTLFSDSATDVASVSNFREVVVTHYHLDLDVNFDRKEITGAVKVDFKCCKDSGIVQLDIHETLTVKTVQLSDGDKKTDLQFEKKPFSGYGSELQVKLNTNVKTGDTFSLFITYVTGDGPGVVWLDPEQTAGKTKPYFYTQGQAVLNRSFFPCQDTPAIKSTYSANVKVPDGFTAVMSTSQRKEPGTVPNMSGETDNVYFNLPFAIPAYLVALAVGDLQSAKIGPRSRVWTEPCVLEKARAEFDGVVEDFIQTGEKLFGTYVWETYDILVMPPSFPFGGWRTHV